MSTYLRWCSQAPFPQTPYLRGTPSWEIGTCVRRLRTQDFAPFLPRGHRPLLSGNLKVSALYGHRLHWHSRGSWSARSPPHRTGKPPRRAEPQRQSEALQKAFLSTFFSEKSRRSRPGIGTRAPKNTLRGATQFQNRATPFPLAPVLRQGGPHPSPGPLVAPSSSGPSP